MMQSSLPLLLLALSSALSAPAPSYEGYTVVYSQKRAALVLDRLLIALQKALRSGDTEPDFAPLALPMLEDVNNMDGAEWDEAAQAALLSDNDLFESPLRSNKDMRPPKRRGKGPKGARKCFFNPVTCY